MPPNQDLVEIANAAIREVMRERAGSGFQVAQRVSWQDVTLKLGKNGDWPVWVGIRLNSVCFATAELKALSAEAAQARIAQAVRGLTLRWEMQEAIRADRAAARPDAGAGEAG